MSMSSCLQARLGHGFTIATIACAITATSAQAGTTTFQFNGVVTALSNGDIFGGVSMGDAITGTLAYNASTAPTRDLGFWAATYDLSAPDTLLSLQLPSGQQHALSSFTARVMNGPVYPHFESDEFSVGSSYLNAMQFVSTGQRLSIGLTMRDETGVGALNSNQLPTEIDLTRMRYSGGTLSVITGQLPAEDEFYIMDRNSLAYNTDLWGSVPSSTSYVLRFNKQTPSYNPYYIPLEPYPGQSEYVNQDAVKYREWLAAGNTPLYLDTLSFHMTSISAVPEPESLALALAGVAGLMVARRRRQA